MDERQLLARIEQLETALDAARKEREETELALRRFSSDVDKLFLRYRSERAWRIMLRIRKTYALLRRGGVPGWRTLTRWALTGFRSDDDLAAYELPVPYIADYLPETASEPKISSVGRGFDVVILPVIEFNYRVGRPQHLAIELARRGHRVFWVSPARLAVPGNPPKYSLTAIRENLVEVQLVGEPIDLHGGHPSDLARSTLFEALDRLFRDQQIGPLSCVIVQFPFWRETALRLRDAHAARIVYDCMDDWRNWPAEPRISGWGIEQENLLAAECDVLAVSASALQERFAARGITSVLIRNGVEFDRFQQVQAESPPATYPAPVIGYYGSIAPWFDVELMAQVCGARPGYSFVFIGQVHGVDITPLKSCSNAYLPGERHYRELPAILEGFDVAIIPFRLTELIRSVDPVKVYEYLSRGKPVVATSMPELKICGNLIAFADNADAFAAAIDHALANPETGRLARIEFARQNTWSKRAADLEAAVDAAFRDAGADARR